MSSSSSSSRNQIPSSYTAIDIQDQASADGYVPKVYSEKEIFEFDLNSPEYLDLFEPFSTPNGPSNYDHRGTSSWNTMASQAHQQQPPLSHPVACFPGNYHQESVGVLNVGPTDFNRHGEDGPIHPHLPSTGPVYRTRAERALLIPSTALSGPPNHDHAGSSSSTPMPLILTGNPQQFQTRPQQPPLRHRLPSFPKVHHQGIAGIPVSSVVQSHPNRHGGDKPIQPHHPFTSPAPGRRPWPITVPSTPTAGHLYRQPLAQIPYLPGLHTGELGKPNHMSNRAFLVGNNIRSETNLVERALQEEISGRSQLESNPLDLLPVNTSQPQEVVTRDVALEGRRSVPALQMPDQRQPFIPSPVELQPESGNSSSTTSTSNLASDGSGSSSGGSGSEAHSSPLTSPHPPSSHITLPSLASPSASSSLQSAKRKRAEDEATPSSPKPVKKPKQKPNNSRITAKPGKKRAVYQHHPYNPSAPKKLPQMWNTCTGQKEDRPSWGERVRDDNNYFIRSAPLTQQFRLSSSATLSSSSGAVEAERPDLFRFSATSCVTLNLFGGQYLKENPRHKATKQEIQALFDGLSEKEKKAWGQRRQDKLASKKAATV